MKKIIYLINIVLILFIESNVLHAFDYDKYDSLYIIALEKYIIESHKDSVSNDIEHKYYSRDIYIIDNISTNIFDINWGYRIDSLGGKKIIEITPDNIEEISEINDYNLITLRLGTLKFSNDGFYITITPLRTNIDDDFQISYIISDWVNFYFDYDCTKKEFKYLYKKTGGI